MYYLIFQIFLKLVDFLFDLPGSKMGRTFWEPFVIMIFYAIQIAIVLIATNRFKATKPDNGWLKAAHIWFCVEGFLCNILIYWKPDTTYPIWVAFIELIIAIVLLVLLLINLDEEKPIILRLFGETLLIGYGFFMIINLAFAIWSWGAETIWIKAIAVIMIIAACFKVATS